MSDPRTNHLTEPELHAAAEGQLDTSSADTIERHLESCAACRGDVERIRALLHHASALPREIDPPADLWPGIRDRMQSARVTANRGGLPRRAYAWLAAAAVLLVIASSALTMLILRGGDQPVATAHDGTGGLDSLGAADFRRVSAEYERMDRDLAAQLATQRDKLLPETIEKVERNLAIIDQAISEIRQALAEDPNNKALQQLLKASYGHKQALLRQVSQS